VYQTVSMFYDVLSTFSSTGSAPKCTGELCELFSGLH
jgi:hypothetical protein